MAPACGVAEQGVAKGRVHFPFHQRRFTCGFLGVRLLIYKKMPPNKILLDSSIGWALGRSQQRRGDITDAFADLEN